MNTDDYTLIDQHHPHRVVCAAIRLDEVFHGLIICGVRHFDTFMIAQLKAINMIKAFRHDQGFVDNRFKYLSRGEAYAVALAAKQFDPDSPKYTGIRGTLFSEDVW